MYLVNNSLIKHSRSRFTYKIENITLQVVLKKIVLYNILNQETFLAFNWCIHNMVGGEVLYHWLIGLLSEHIYLVVIVGSIIIMYITHRYILYYGSKLCYSKLTHLFMYYVYTQHTGHLDRNTYSIFIH